MKRKLPGYGYLRSFARFGATPQALQWSSYRAAALRYQQLVKYINFDDKTILDAGCGMGDLLPFIYAKSDSFNYLGVDVIPDFIKIANQRYTGHNFRVADPFSGDLQGKSFDIVLCCGVMNANTPNWLEERKHKIAALFSLTSETLAFNMAGGLQPPRFSAKSRVAYAKASDIVDFCRTLTSNVKLYSDYHSKDFMVILHK